jgi:hypothetical protein
MYNQAPMPLKWIEYKEKKLLFIEVANLANNHDALRIELEALVSLLKDEPKNSVLALADLRNTHLNNHTLLTLMSNAPLAAPHFCKSALVIERNNARRIVLDSLGHFIGHLPKRFEDLDEAKEWLVSEKA